MGLEELLAKANDSITVGRVFGTPIERDGVLVIPVAAVQGGGGERISAGGLSYARAHCSLQIAVERELALLSGLAATA